VSFDKQNFARTVSEQQAGISPQMWPIKLDPTNGVPPGPATVGLNSPYEVEINPCDCIWLPITYDKSYGVNGIQSDPAWSYGFVDPAIAGSNIFEMWDAQSNWLTFEPPIFGLRFNSPNNPWLLWGLGTLQASSQMYGNAVQNFRSGGASLMRSITGPISRLWCQYYKWGGVRYGHAPDNFVATYQQVILLSMLGFRQETREFMQPATNIVAAPDMVIPPETWTSLSCGGYRTTDLNSADLRVLGANPVPVAPTTAGAGSTNG
jgi:hypothetical protein